MAAFGIRHKKSPYPNNIIAGTRAILSKNKNSCGATRLDAVRPLMHTTVNALFFLKLLRNLSISAKANIEQYASVINGVSLRLPYPLLLRAAHSFTAAITKVRSVRPQKPIHSCLARRNLITCGSLCGKFQELLPLLQRFS
ncbi:MAG: hypothetical protein QM697_15980 [Lachnospiraceae bacterium]